MDNCDEEGQRAGGGLKMKEKLVKAVLENSREQYDIDKAVLEWKLVKSESADMPGVIQSSMQCVCDYPRLLTWHTLVNDVNGKTLYPIGNVCLSFFPNKVREEYDRLKILGALTLELPGGGRATYDQCFHDVDLGMSATRYRANRNVVEEFEMYCERMLEMEGDVGSSDEEDDDDEEDDEDYLDVEAEEDDEEEESSDEEEVMVIPPKRRRLRRVMSDSDSD